MPDELVGNWLTCCKIDFYCQTNFYAAKCTQAFQTEFEFVY